MFALLFRFPFPGLRIFAHCSRAVCDGRGREDGIYLFTFDAFYDLRQIIWHRALRESDKYAVVYIPLNRPNTHIVHIIIIISIIVVGCSHKEKLKSRKAVQMHWNILYKIIKHIFVCLPCAFSQCPTFRSLSLHVCKSVCVCSFVFYGDCAACIYVHMIWMVYVPHMSTSL